jgi:O-antigen ligase
VTLSIALPPDTNGSRAGASDAARPMGRAVGDGLGGLAAWLTAIVVLTPLPLASNRPIIWIGFAIVVGLIATVYGQRRAAALTVPAGRVSVAAYALLVGMMLFQVLPLGTLFPVRPDIAAPAVSLVPGATWLALLQTLGYGVFAYLAMQVAGPPRRAILLLLAVFIAIAAYAVLGIVQLLLLDDTILGMTKWSSRGMVSATFVNRNSFATFLAFGLAIGAGLAIAQLGHRHREQWPLSRWWLALLVIGCGIIAAALVMTQSRMGVIAGAAAVAVVCIAGLARTLGAAWTLLAVAALAVAGAGLAFVLAPNLIDRLLAAQGPAELRLELYVQVWRMIWERPLIGYGGGAFELAFPLFHEPSLSTRATWDRAHSTYLTLWSELGIVAGSIPMLLIAIFAWRAIAGFRAGGATFAPGLAAIGVVVAGAVHSTADFSLEIPANVYLFWFVLALGAFAGTRTGAPVQVARPTSGPGMSSSGMSSNEA